MTLNSSLEMDLQPRQRQSYSYSSKKHRFLLAAVTVALVVVAFVCGYLIGRVFPLRESMPLLNSQISWQEAICLPERQCPPSFDHSPVILLSLDGFAARYLDRHYTPHLERIMNCGSHPPFMNPVFPSKTFSNHYSIVTGLYPSSHGIVDNTMHDPQFNKTFKISSTEARNKSWWGGEPIWVTAKKQGVKAATYFWPGSDVYGMQADYYIRYNKSTPFVDRVNQVLRWLDLPAERRPRFITLYFEEPDSSGHKYGPDSKQTNDALKSMDLIIDMLMRELHSRSLIGCVNLMIVSDHGMTGTSCDRVVFLNEMVKNFSTNGMFFVHGSVGHLRPLTNYSDTDIVELKDKFQCKSPHVWAYDANDVPVRWLYFGHRRIDPIIFDVKHDWLINANVYRRSGYCDGGDHGYDNALPSMSAIFIAAGPDFKINYTSDPFTNVEIYNLLTELLNLEPSPNNGTEGALNEMLRFPRLLPTSEFVANSICASDTSDEIHNDSDCPEFFSRKNSTFDDNDLWLRKVPWGLPVEAELTNSICTLPNEKYVTGYSQKARVPLWSTFNFDNVVNKEVSNGTKWFLDERLSWENTPPCSRFDVKDDVVQVPLVPSQFFDNVFVVSNAVPMYEGFHRGVFRLFWSKVSNWASFLNFVNVIVGPVWINGRPKTEIPSHYFIVFTYAIDTGCDLSTCKVDTMGFVLPHQKHIPSCWNIDEYLSKHRSSVNHIELMTGLRFYTSLPQSESLQLRLKLVTHQIQSSPSPFSL